MELTVLQKREILEDFIDWAGCVSSHCTDQDLKNYVQFAMPFGNLDQHAALVFLQEQK